MKYFLLGLFLLFVTLFLFLFSGSDDQKKPQNSFKSQMSPQLQKEENVFIEVKESHPKKVKVKKFKNREDVHNVEKRINEENLKPLYKEWKNHNGVRYNIYSVDNTSSESFKDNPTPPAVPTFVKANIGGDLVPLVIPSSGVHYLVIDNGDDLETTVLQNNNGMTPPTIH